MILYIAEKPSVGRAVADVLPKPQQKGDGYIKVGSGDIVTWCIGHLLEQAEPDAYNPDYKKWKKEHLPIIPKEWKLEVKNQTRKQFNTVKRLIKEADQLINMGDPDRVGQILVDEVINYSSVSKSKRDATLRCLVNDMNPDAIKKALSNLRKNTDFIPLATSALARARADWLYGINMTRLCTLLGQNAGYNGILSIGRVQTPVLGLIVHRDNEIDDFASKPFYEVFITLKTLSGESFIAKWKPSDACTRYMDDDGHVLSRKLAEVVTNKVIGHDGSVKSVIKDKIKQAAPLPYNLSALQIDASNRFNLNAQKTLEICQQLYERHKLITYPRSDCRYLPKGHFDDRKTVVQSIAKTIPKLEEVLGYADLGLRSKAWNDSKVSAHHAIIPTSRSMSSNNLSNDERNIYDLIARQYLMQFYPSFEYEKHQIDSVIEGGLFIAKQKSVIFEGWKVLLTSSKNAQKDSEFSLSKLPDVKIGDLVNCIDGRLDQKQTSPPKRFTDASLLAAMTGISRFVSDPEIKKVLRDTDGLGTEATRAGIIELLFKRQFLTKKGKEIHSTDIGKQLVKSLPKRMVTPDMTAHWESQLEAISEKKIRYNNFMEPLNTELNILIKEMENQIFTGLKGMGTKTLRNKKSQRKKTNRST